MAKAPSKSPLEEAIDEVRADLKRKDCVKNEFYKELLNSESQLDSPRDGTPQSQISADKLRQYLKDLEPQVRGRRDYHVLSRVGPFVDSLQLLMQNCETLFQSTPFGVSVVFSGAQILLRISSTLSDYFDTVLEAMDRIGKIIVCYEKFARAYSDPQVQRCLVSSYQKIILFWGEASQTLAQNNIKSTFKMAFKSIARPLDREIKAALDGIEKDTMDVQRIAQATEAEQTAKDRAEKRRKAILDWILGQEEVDTRLQLHGQLERRQAGTCTWLFDEPRFKDWKDAKENAILWYNAPPGSGKSVLSSAVVDHLVSEGRDVAYSFYSFSDPWRRHGLNGLRSLALQLIIILENHGHPIPDKVTSIYENAIKLNVSTMNSVVTATQVVHQLINVCPHVYLVIDGLDECADENQMLSMLDLLFQTRTHGLAKWLLTSRNDHSKIRTIMEKYKAASITPDPLIVSNDIQTYFSATVALECEKCVANWVEDCDTSFLYASIICDILRGQNFTCQEEIDQALRAFPPELNTYYVQLLEKLSKRSEQKQELARRVFLILIASSQSISLNELLNALAISPGARDHSSSRERGLRDIEDLCMPLITFDKSGKGTLENPIVKLYHKTVEDFFLQGLDTLNIRQDLRKFFVTPQSSVMEMGLSCLTYLQYERYTQPLDPKVLLAEDSKEHAFLPYAATFWSQHLTDTPPTPEIDKQIRDFVMSPNFWTCLSVQSRLAKYLFARYTAIAADRGAYTMGIKTSESTGLESLVALPLPQWFGTYSPDSMVLDSSFCCFVEEWREVLTRYPEGLNLCVPVRQFSKSCHLMPLGDEKRIKAAYLEEGYTMDAVSEVQLLDVSFSKKTLWADVVYRERGDTARVKRSLIPLYSPKKKPSPPISHSLPFADGWLLSVTRREGGNEAVEAWSINPQTLEVRHTAKEFSEKHKPPSSLHQDLLGRTDGGWEVLSMDTMTGTEKTPPIRVFHMVWRPKKREIQMHDEDDEDGDVDALEADSSEEEDSDDDTSDEESVAEESDSQDDRDSEDGSSRAESEDRTDSEEDSSVTEYSSDDGGDINDCLILVPQSGQPYWHHWSSSSNISGRIACSTHPSLPLIAVTHTPCQLELIGVENQTRKTVHLPELSDLDDSPEASTRELRFSPCGNFLHFLSVAFTSDETSTTCRLTVSTFNFNASGNVDNILVRECPASSCTYTFGDRLCDTPHPLALTHWADNHVVVALPSLTCDPKIIKVALNCAGASAISTLRKPIYFPTSMPRRKPRLLYRPGTGGKDDCIYLALGALIANNSGNPSLPADSSAGTSSEDSVSRASPPVVLRWKIGAEEGWGAWDPETDSKSEDVKKGGNLWNVLRGTFVESEKCFSVPVRSGLDWRRKGYLSCG